LSGLQAATDRPSPTTRKSASALLFAIVDVSPEASAL